MRILLVTPSYKPANCYGGPIVSVSELAEALVAIGYSVTVYTTTANGKRELDVPIGREVKVNGVSVYYYSRITGDHTHISVTLWWKLWKTIKDFEIIHLQSWWSLLIVGAALVCRLHRRDYILSPRGMLGAYSFKNQHSFFKKVLHKLLGKRLLKSSVLHATSLLEWKDCTQVYNQWKGFVIHNLIRLPPVKLNNGIKKATPVFTIGFLSRIDPKKGIELLLKALANVPFNFKFRIAGSGDEKYIASLKLLATELDISDKIEWCGWLKGDVKFDFFRSIDLFALTSYNENFAIAVTESLAMGTPVLISDNVGLADYVKEKGLGWICCTTVQSIQDELIQVYINRKDLVRKYNAVSEVISKDFNNKVLGHQYINAYKGILSNNTNSIKAV